VGFNEVEFEPAQGLVVISGPSGAGKSVLVSALLSLFGFDSRSEATLAEAIVRKPPRFEAEGYDIEDDELYVKRIKKEKVRFFLNAQTVSKKQIRTLFAPYVSYLSARDQSGLESEALLEIVDAYASDDKDFKKLKKEYRRRFARYETQRRTYERLVAEERSVAERREFLRFEIDKIASVDPKEGEEEELLSIKRRLSRLDKLKAAVEEASAVFAYESAVENFYALIEGDATLFSEAMNRLRIDLEEGEAMLAELEEIDVESVLDRLGELNGLVKRFGSIAEALAYKEEKERELAQTEKLEHDKTELERYLEMEFLELSTLAARLHTARVAAAKRLEEAIAPYLASLKLPAVTFRFDEAPLSSSGIDRIAIDLDGSSLETLSGGEFNRVRLAMMAVAVPKSAHTHRGVLILDEIDANVSGDESIAIAELIERLSEAYQIFAISHQPHLTAKADTHLLVRKQDGESRVYVLESEDERIAEIARIVGGASPSEEAVEFAKKLRTNTL
jgi:DNA repair protein RecN (Recombination protein N)